MIKLLNLLNIFWWRRRELNPLHIAPLLDYRRLDPKVTQSFFDRLRITQ